MFKGAKKILVIKLRHIGDVLLTVPAIRALRQTFPGAAVTALVNSGTEEMLTLNPVVDRVVSFDRSVKGLSAHRRITEELKFVSGLRGEGFDMTVDLTGGDRAALLGFATGARFRLGYDPEGSGFAGKKFFYTHLARRPSLRTHTVLSDLGLLRQFGISTDDLTVDIHSSPQDDAFVEKALEDGGLEARPFVHVHPTSRWLFKCWTDEGMACVMDSIQEAGLRAVVTSGPDEKELQKVRSIIGLMRSRPIDLSGRLRLKHLAGLSRRAAFFFGVDSAPMHIAAAAGAKVVSIFGPSGAFDWGPWDNAAVKRSGVEARGVINSPYNKKNGVQRYGSNVVIQHDWECIPCGKDGCDGTKKSECLDGMEPSLVWRIVSEEMKNDL